MGNTDYALSLRNSGVSITIMKILQLHDTSYECPDCVVSQEVVFVTPQYRLIDVFSVARIKVKMSRAMKLDSVSFYTGG